MTKSFTIKNLYFLSATVLLLAFAYSAFAQEDSMVASDQALVEESSVPVSEEYLRRPPIDNKDRIENRQEIIEERQDRIEERKTEVEGKIEERKIQIEERVEEGKIKMEERREAFTERRTALKAVQQQRIVNLAANISNRMDSAIARLFTIIERLEERIAKMKEAGVATGPAEEKLREAARNLSEARGLMQDIDTNVNDATTSAEPVGKWQSVRERYLSVGKLIRQSHQNLRETVALLKEATKQEIEAKREDDAGATTTPTLAE